VYKEEEEEDEDEHSKRNPSSYTPLQTAPAGPKQREAQSGSPHNTATSPKSLTSSNHMSSTPLPPPTPPVKHTGRRMPLTPEAAAGL